MKPTPLEIQEQLDRITLSRDFQASQGLIDFLRFVVEETLAGRADEINQRTVGIKGLGYAPNFDSRSNPAVRMQAGRLRRALDQYYLTQGVEDPLRIEIPKGGYVPVFLSHNSHPESAGATTKKVESSSNQLTPQSQGHDGPSIAILPFEYMGNGGNDAYIASGITEEIVIALTRFPDFLVVGPLNREILQGKHLDSRGIGREYNVRFLLDGTVRLRDHSLRLTAKLTDTLSGRHMWGQAYDYVTETTSVGQVENEIVDRVVSTIADNFGVIPRTLADEFLTHPEESLSNYEAVLRFHHFNRILTEKSMIEAIAALQRTIEHNPKHDLAMALLADLVGGPYFMGFSDDLSVLEQAESLARKALTLNPNSQQAHYAMAQIHYQRYHRALCLTEIELVLELNPNNANYLAISALFLMGLGQGERSLSLIGKAMRLNPHHPGWYYLIPFLHHYYQGENEAALLEANKFNTPAYFWDPLIRTAVLGQLGHQGEADKAAGELLALVPDFGARGRSLIQRMLFQDEHVEMILDGLKKAGMVTF